MKFIVAFLDFVTLKSYLYKNMSQNMSDKISEHNAEYSKFLITLSINSIALTFVVLQILSEDISKDYIFWIRASWYLFTTTILLGLIFKLLDIVRIFFHSNENRLAGDSSTFNKIPAEKIDEIIENALMAHNIVRYSFLVLILQTIAFFLSVISLVVFLTLNF